MESGSNKSLYTLIAVVVFGIFLSLSYFLFQDQLKGVLASVMDGTSEMTSTKLEYNGLITTDEKYFVALDNGNGTCTITDYNVSASGSTDVLIPTTINGLTVTTIGSIAFYNKGLTSITFPSTVTKINNGIGVYDPDNNIDTRIGAFSNNNIKTLILPDTLKYVGYWAFVRNGMTSVDLGSITYAGNYAFYNNNLTEVTIPSTLKTVNGGLFQANKLTSVIMEDGITHILGWAFGSNKIVELTLPSTITNIDSTFIVYNYGLTHVKLPQSISSTFDVNNLKMKYGRDPVTNVMINIVNYDSSIFSFY